MMPETRKLMMAEEEEEVEVEDTEREVTALARDLGNNKKTISRRFSRQLKDTLLTYVFLNICCLNDGPYAEFNLSLANSAAPRLRALTRLCSLVCRFPSTTPSFFASNKMTAHCIYLANRKSQIAQPTS